MSPSQPGSVMLHLGLGSFHRAHQAVYLQQLRDAGDRRWELQGGNLRPDQPELIETLRRQGGAYTLETVSPDGLRRYERIRSIRRVLPWEPTLSGLVRAGADARTRIVSITVTEAGYYLDDRQRLDTRHPDLAADLEGRSCGTVYGALARLLEARRQRGSGPLTLLNCDNLRHNGERLRAGLLDFLAQSDQPALLEWVQSHTRCPNAMVDRITPRPSPAVRERVLAATGEDDPAALMAESFIQWVIEDDFPAGRPDWETVGVQMVDSVLPYEEAKIRILNASHSCIAWAGTLLGLRYIHEGTQDERIRRYAHEYVTEDVMPCLHRPGRPSPVDLAAYRDTVLQRFGNPAIEDTNQRVAMDGFSKIPGFIAPTLRERLAEGAPARAVARLPALFLAFLQRWHRGQLPYEYQDQAMDPALAHAICGSHDPVAALCADAGLWGELAGDASLTRAVATAYEEIQHLTGVTLD
ncbi:D-arabinitol 4-dehydrogenase [Eleftheria terrae]|uniref:D-arabinitol 4-dehydrogenase n=1 Tax=Eleftheria terrae TaxID=1597781 RepID=UPI00263A9629|nr:D-arabinitol 4-dehydrogenase [Eleftheria terrae]WKB51055.1 mannitol dehydrogenase family protein [Eleftheria terrae]